MHIDLVPHIEGTKFPVHWETCTNAHVDAASKTLNDLPFHTNPLLSLPIRQDLKLTKKKKKR